MEVPSIKHILSNCLLLTIVIAQTPQKLTSQNPCTSKINCHECIQTPSCAWCFDPKYKGESRCFQPADGVLSNKLCHEEYVLNPVNILSIIQNASLTRATISGGGGGGSMQGMSGGSFQYSGSSSSSSSSGSFSASSASASGAAGGRRVQITPQRLKLKLRARQSYSVMMYFTQTDSPIDLYYLMDLSKSMEDDKIKLYSLGDRLAETMKRLTSDFRLGFGSFVDKVVMPYVNTLPENLRHPCPGCAAPYGFRHAMMLSSDSSQFSDMVKKANVSGNLDAPEGGFDAIMQAVVCEDQIGWRKTVRRLLVFSTDASFHFAGDGKLGGIVKPNDGCCHLSREGIYTESSFQDYPSIEQINLSVKKNRINVIFAVTKSIMSIYQQLAENIEGATVGMLEGDSSNIVELVKEQYEQISKRVEMKHNASKAVSVKFYTKCTNSEGALVHTNICDSVKVGDVIEFKIDIEVVKCPKNPADYFQTIQIYPVGISESLIIDLEMLCDCACERPGHKFYEENSGKCSNHGTYKCGICECTGGAFGRRCECNQEKSIKSSTSCINKENPTAPECSGRGQCVCGECQCEPRGNNERIYGKYCQCDNFSCARHDGKLCSGHGTCDCGNCTCYSGWTGDNCACSTDITNCYPHGATGNKTCSGNGECVCGQCVCDVKDGSRYTGKFCEKCPTCPDRCSELKDCVLCQQYKTGPLKDECSNCTLFTPKEEAEVTADEEKGEVKCWYEHIYEDGKKCYYAFVYYYDEDNKLQVKAQKEMTCSEPVHLPALILGVIAAVVLIGMAMLLLWKVFTTIHDKREFARFEKERMMAKWDTGENPIYKQATSTYKNPTYSAKGY